MTFWELIFRHVHSEEYRLPWCCASQLSMLYSGLIYTITLHLEPYNAQLYTFWVQAQAFFLPWTPDYNLKYSYK